MVSKKKNIAIITDDYLKRSNKKEFSIGGVQSYNGALIELLSSIGCGIDVYQLSEKPFVNTEIKNVNSVFGVGSNPTSLKKAFLKSKKRYAGVIFSKFNRCFRIDAPTVAINHGIPFDGLLLNNNGLIRNIQTIRESLRKHFQPYIEKSYCLRVDKVICVDTNFGNFMRASFPHELYFWNEHLRYVPNFTDFKPDKVSFNKWTSAENELIIAFPRRFEIIRGVLEWMKIVKSVSEIRDELTFIFAGNGTFERNIRDMFSSNKEKVIIKAIPHSEMCALYDSAHIVVIPSICSEGTSLSAIEAMSRNCVVLCTTIGGLGNLIISGYNGILCDPTERMLEKNLLSLINNVNLMKRLAVNAGETAKSAFSRESWEKKILDILEETGII